MREFIQSVQHLSPHRISTTKFESRLLPLPPSWISAANDEYTMAWEQKGLYKTPLSSNLIVSCFRCNGSSFSLNFFWSHAEEAKCCFGLVASKLSHKTTKQLCFFLSVCQGGRQEGGGTGCGRLQRRKMDDRGGGRMRTAGRMAGRGGVCTRPAAALGSYGNKDGRSGGRMRMAGHDGWGLYAAGRDGGFVPAGNEDGRGEGRTRPAVAGCGCDQLGPTTGHQIVSDHTQSHIGSCFFLACHPFQSIVD